MRVSVILSTYNAPEWLEKVVWGYSVQSRRDFDVLVADDGSTYETSLLVHRLRRQTGLNIHHVWHEDRGFRKCTILNRAIEAATGDYLIFSDGDCIPPGTSSHGTWSLPGPDACSPAVTFGCRWP